MASQSNSLKSVKNETSELQSKMDFLERNLNTPEQMSLLTSLEIHGIPEKPDENVNKLFNDVAQKLGVEINREDVQCLRQSSL